MIQAKNHAGATRSDITNGKASLAADTSPPHGSGEGFRPHDLLEAALASCMAITLRMVAAEKGMPLQDAEVTVSLDRSGEGTVTVRSQAVLQGPLTEEQKRSLLAALRLCPVRKTLARGLRFEEG